MRLLCKLHFVFLAQYYCSEIHEVLHLFHDKFDLDISRNHVWLYASTGIVNDLLHGQLRLREASDHVDSQDSYSHISYSVCAQSWYHANPESLHGRRQGQTSAQCASCCRSKAVSCHFFHFSIVFRFRKGSPPPPKMLPRGRDSRCACSRDGGGCFRPWRRRHRFHRRCCRRNCRLGCRPCCRNRRCRPVRWPGRALRACSARSRCSCGR